MLLAMRCAPPKAVWKLMESTSDLTVWKNALTKLNDLREPEYRWLAIESDAQAFDVIPAVLKSVADRESVLSKWHEGYADLTLRDAVLRLDAALTKFQKEVESQRVTAEVLASIQGNES